MPLRANERDIRSRNPFDFGEQLRFDAATVTKIKISPGTPIYFAKYPGLRRNILGRLGWIRNLQIGLRDYENKLFVSEYRREE
jgi:hypothetical protein